MGTQWGQARISLDQFIQHPMNVSIIRKQRPTLPGEQLPPKPPNWNKPEPKLPRF